MIFPWQHDDVRHAVEGRASAMLCGSAIWSVLNGSKSPIAMIERMVVTAVPAWQVGLSLGLLALGVRGGLWLAARLFRVNMLLAGQLPGRRELAHLPVRGQVE